MTVTEMTAAANDRLPVPSSTDDRDTRNVIISQANREKYTMAGIALICFLPALSGFREGIGTFVIALIGSAIAFAVLSAIVEWVVFKPMRALRYGPCTKRILEIAQAQIDSTKWHQWKSPLPQVIAINPATLSIFVEGPDTDFYGLTLTPEHIIDVKVEREQTVHTTTRHGARFGYSFGSTGIGILGGGRSRSTSKVIETAFLEISYVTDLGSTPRRVVFPFGTQRREADDWALSINHLRSR